MLSSGATLKSYVTSSDDLPIYNLEMYIHYHIGFPDVGLSQSNDWLR